MKYKAHLSILSILSILIIVFFISIDGSQKSNESLHDLTPLKNDIAQTNNPVTQASNHDSNKPLANSPPQITITKKDAEILSEFKTWLDSKPIVGQQQEWQKKGLALAQQRQPLMRRLIQTKPQLALKQAVFFHEYAKLPQNIQTYVEQPFSQTIDLVVLPNEAQNKATKHRSLTTPPSKQLDNNLSYIEVNQQHVRVYRYGQRNTLLSKQNLAVQGIILNQTAAIQDRALMPIVKADQAYIQQHFSNPNAKPNQTKKDFYTGKPIVGEPVLALAGGKVLAFASHKSLQTLNSQLAQLEQINHPQSTANILAKYTNTTSNTSNSPLPLSQRLAKLLAKPSDWTTSVKKVLLIRVITADANGTAVTQSDLQTR
jgi:hypothetical protein